MRKSRVLTSYDSNIRQKCPTRISAGEIDSLSSYDIFLYTLYVREKNRFQGAK